MTNIENSNALSAKKQALLARFKNRAQEIKPSSIPRRVQKEWACLSPMQESLWLLSHLEGAQKAYTETAAVRIEGPLDICLLEEVINEIANRHESLRTVFMLRGENPLQKILPSVEIPLFQNSVEEAPEAKREEAALDFLLKQSQIEFDFKRAPLLRVSLVKLSEGSWILGFAVPHIIFDELSARLFLAEMISLYEAQVRKKPSTLSALEVDYGDYAEWIRGRTTSEEWKNHLEYWRKKLAGDLEPLSLPTDYPRPKVQTFDGKTFNFRFEKSLAQGLHNFAQKQGFTSYTVGLAAYQALLALRSGQKDIFVGTPVAGRVRPELDRLFGVFINTLVLRNQFSGNPKLMDILNSSRTTLFEAFTHQEYPFSLLVKNLLSEQGRSLDRNPFFQTLFTLRQKTSAKYQMGDVVLTPIEMPDAGISQFDLTLDIRTDEEGGLQGSFEYNTHLFNEETIKSLADHYQHLLKNMIEEPEKRLNAVAFPSPEEKNLVLNVLNQTETEAVDPTPVHLRFSKNAKKYPSRPAATVEFSDGINRSISYEELDIWSHQIARYLQQCGVKRGESVVLLLDRSLEMAAGMLGVLKAGASYIPLETTLPKNRIQFLIQDSNARAVLTQSQYVSTAGETDRLVLVLDKREVLESTSKEPVESFYSPVDPAYVMYTSGSTGTPKGVVVPHQAVINHLDWMQSHFPLRETDAVLQKTSYGFDVSVWEFFAAWSVGACVVFPEPGGHRDNRFLIKLLQKYGIRFLQTTPAQLETMLSDSIGLNRIKLEHIFCGGEAPSRSLFELCVKNLPQCSFHNMYGPTETCIDALRETVDEKSLFGDSLLMGEPVSNTQVYLLDSDLQPVPLGAIGEIYIAGKSLAHGYLNAPGTTARTFLPNPFSLEPGARLYRSGDLARRLSNRKILFLGRRDHQVKLRGIRIELGEIENAILRVPEVFQCLVKIEELASGEKTLAAFFTTYPEKTVEEGGLRHFLFDSIPAHMVPSVFVHLDKFPLTSSGKLDRRALRVPQNVSLSQGARAESPTEKKLERIWSELFQVAEVGVEKNFFSELGGHSLLAVKLVSRIEKSFGMALPLKSVFERPTIRALAQTLLEADLQPAHGSPLELKRQDLREELPLSFAQERLWFLDQLNPNSSFYNISRTLRLKGKLDTVALQKSLNTILERQELLRTNYFSGENATPKLRISSEPQLFFKSADFTHVNESEREEVLKKELLKNLNAPFNLSDDSLLRVWHFSYGEETHLLQFSFHHIICDEWSMEVFFSQLSELYATYLQGALPEPQNLPVQYSDFAHWQRQRLSGERLNIQLNYWKEKLGGQLPLLQLPTDRARPSVQGYRGGVVSLSLSEKTSSLLRDYSRAEGATLFMTLFGLYQVFLSRYCNQSDLIIGTPVTNRNQQELEDLMGYFINTLAVRAPLNPKHSLREHLSNVRETLLEAYAQADIPFEKLVEELQPQRDLSRSPLFQSMFILNQPDPGFQFANLEAEDLILNENVSKFDLTLYFVDEKEALTGHLEYSTDLFNPETIERLARNLEFFVECAVEKWDDALNDLSWVRPNEKSQTLYGWNETERPYKNNVSVHSLFEVQVVKTPNAVALKFNDKELTYRELNEKANELAHYLQKSGVGVGSLIGLFVERSFEMVIAMLATLKSGAAYVPLDPDHPVERLKTVAADAELKMILTQSHLRNLWTQSDGQTLVSLDETDFSYFSNSNPVLKDFSDAQLAYTIYTSGSTGVPKGVMVSHRSVSHNSEWMQKHFTLGVGDNVLQKTPFGFDLSVWEFYCSLLSGATLVLAKAREHRDPSRLLDLIETEKITILYLVPSLLKILLEEDPKRLSSVKRFLCIGEALPLELVQSYFKKIPDGLFNLYGPTEATVHVTSTPCSKDQTVVSIGVPMDNIQMYVLDGGLNPLPIGVSGELFISGIGLARGYLKRPDLTAEKFIPNPYSKEPGARMYRTGDLARYLPDGQIEFLGRCDFQVKIRGFRVELGDIDSALKKFPGVSDALTIFSDPELTSYLVTDASQFNENAVLAHLRNLLPDYMVPSNLIPLQSLPLNNNGKVDRKRLPLPEKQKKTSSVLRPAMGPKKRLSTTEEELQKIWKEVLNVEVLNSGDNFFELGGNSLRIAQVKSKIQERLNKSISIVDLFRYPTLNSLVDLMESGQK